MNTKETILMAALKLFSEKGFDGVSMRDIAAEVGIKAASIYNHFSGKEEIYQSLLDEMMRRYGISCENAQVPAGSAETTAGAYENITPEALLAISRNLFLYFLKDDFAAPFRRMTASEQFRSSPAGQTFRDIFINGALDYETEIFTKLVETGHFKKCNPRVAALQFYSPIFLMLTQYDQRPDKEEEALKLLDEHVLSFAKAHANN